MSKGKSKTSLKGRQIEDNTTAAWANIHKTKNISNVGIPSEIDVENAKDWVEENKK